MRPIAGEERKTVTRWAVTHLNKDGMRTLIYANQRRNFSPTKEDAAIYKQAILSNNSEATLKSVYGFPLEVRPVECIIMKDGREGDAINVWFD